MRSPIDPVEADLCPVCLHDQNHDMSEGNCAQCGGELDGVRFHLEVEFPLRPAELPGNLTVALYGEYCDWMVHHINIRGVRPTRLFTRCTSGYSAPTRSKRSNHIPETTSHIIARREAVHALPLGFTYTAVSIPLRGCHPPP